MSEPVTKPKKPLHKRWWFIALVAVVAIAFLANLAGGGDEEATGEPSGTTEAARPAAEEPATQDAPDDEPAVKDPAVEDPEPEEPQAAGIGESVSSGDLSIVVASVGEPITSIGDDVLGTTAQGEFIVVDVEVTNDGNQAENFHSGQVKLKAGEREFEPDSTAGIYLGQDRAMLFDKINPGNTLKGAVVFDVPAGTTPEVLEFRGSLLGTPAEIALG